jgi:hypothetical protein
VTSFLARMDGASESLSGFAGRRHNDRQPPLQTISG